MTEENLFRFSEFLFFYSRAARDSSLFFRKRIFYNDHQSLHRDEGEATNLTHSSANEKKH